ALPDDGGAERRGQLLAVVAPQRVEPSGQELDVVSLHSLPLRDSGLDLEDQEGGARARPRVGRTRSGDLAAGQRQPGTWRIVRPSRERSNRNRYARDRRRTPRRFGARSFAAISGASRSSRLA